MKWRISQKLLGPLLAGGMAMIAVLSAVSVRVGTRLLLEEETAALDGLRASRQAYIQKYFEFIRAQMSISSQNRMIGQAVCECLGQLRLQYRRLRLCYVYLTQTP